MLSLGAIRSHVNHTQGGTEKKGFGVRLLGPDPCGFDSLYVFGKPVGADLFRKDLAANVTEGRSESDAPSDALAVGSPDRQAGFVRRACSSVRTAYGVPVPEPHATPNECPSFSSTSNSEAGPRYQLAVDRFLEAPPPSSLRPSGRLEDVIA